MYGKSFASMFTGSMFGSPAVVFAVWGYAISNQRPERDGKTCTVELNPVLLAAMFRGETPESIDEVLDLLCGPDPASRSEDEAGRRLIPEGERTRLGPTLYRVVNGPKYRAMRDEEERRAYMRDAQRKHRAKKAKSTAVNRGQPPSTQEEVEEEEEVEVDQEEGERAREAMPANLDPDERSDEPPLAPSVLTWQRASVLWVEAMQIEGVTFSPALHEPALRVMVRACKGDEAELARVLGIFAADPWVAETQPGPKHLAGHWTKYAKARTRRGGMAPPSPAAEFDVEGSRRRVEALLGAK